MWKYLEKIDFFQLEQVSIFVRIHRKAWKRIRSRIMLVCGRNYVCVVESIFVYNTGTSVIELCEYGA
jgi:hypothetical protein